MEQKELVVKGLDTIAEYESLKVEGTITGIDTPLFQMITFEGRINEIDEHNQSPFNDIIIAQQGDQSYLLIGKATQDYKKILKEYGFDTSSNENLTIFEGKILNRTNDVLFYARDQSDKRTFSTNDEGIQNFVQTHKTKLEETLRKEVEYFSNDRKAA